MNELNENLSVTSNIVQSITDVLEGLNKDNLVIPNDPKEIANDIIAMINRKLSNTVQGVE